MSLFVNNGESGAGRVQNVLILAILGGVLLLGCGTPPPKAGPQTASKKPKSKGGQPKSQTRPKESATSEISSTAADVIDANPDTAQTKNVETIHRPDDTRPPRDDLMLAEHGFVKVTSKRFVLYSDLPTGDLEGLPDAIDQLYAVLEAYFGPLPPNRQGTPYQMTGYLMEDAQRFRDAKILSEGPAQPHEGWYLGNEFWWNRQGTPYYTRHLMLHEATHCFMHVMPNVNCPPWYVEGMAELFGTHYRDEQGRYAFGVFPDSADRFPGWSRIDVLQDEIAAGKMPGVAEILAYKFDAYAKLPPYAWSWALCQFLNNHPRYQVPFRKLAKRLMAGGFAAEATSLFEPFIPDLRDEWLLFASQIQYRHDIERSAIEFQTGTELSIPGQPQDSKIVADRGWQSTRVKVSAGQRYRVRATGRITLANTTKPWISEPQGISIRYFAGQPLGRLMGMIRPEPPGTDPADRDILKLIPLGPDATFTATHSGTLYLRVNDAWNELADNSGDIQAEIELLPKE